MDKDALLRECHDRLGRVIDQAELNFTLSALVAILRDIRNQMMTALASPGDGWIAVSERLPEPHITVLIWRDDIPRFVGPIMAYWTGAKWCSDVMKPGYYCTHWMPLPNPPAHQNAAPEPVATAPDAGLSEEIGERLVMLFNKTAAALSCSKVDYSDRVKAGLVEVYAYGRRHGYRQALQESRREREGWVRVPMQPTHEMLDAAQDCDAEGQDDALEAFASLYKAMLAARPTRGKKP